MKKPLFLLSFIFLWALPLLAQSELTETYTLETGTRINYPNGWAAETSDNFLIFSVSETSRVVVIDYPVVSAFLNQTNPSLHDLVEVVANRVLESSIDRNEIEALMIQGREGARYRLSNATTNAAGSVVALRFSNQSIGMLLTVNIREALLFALLETYDNALPLRSNENTARGTATEAGRVYIFRAEGRISVPVGWTFRGQRQGDIEYVRLQPTDNPIMTVLAFDLSNIVSDTLPLAAVLERLGTDFADTIGLIYDASSAETLRIGAHEGLSYAAVMQEGSRLFNGTVNIVRFDDTGTGLLIVFGDTRAYQRDISVMMQSFNNIRALLRYVN